MLWVALGPWVWGYASSGSAVASHVFFIFAFGPLTLLLVVLRPAAFVVLAAGLWLAASPWLLGYATNHSAWLSELVTGLLLSIVAARAAGLTRLVTPAARKRRQPATTSRPVEAAGLALVAVRCRCPARRPDPPAATDRRSSRWPLWSALLVASRPRPRFSPSRRSPVSRRDWSMVVATGSRPPVLWSCCRRSGSWCLFKLVFAAPISWRRSVPAALRALGASTVLPGGGLIGPTMGAWSTSNEKPSLSQLTRSTITFVILINAPGRDRARSAGNPAVARAGRAAPIRRVDDPSGADRASGSSPPRGSRGAPPGADHQRRASGCSPARSPSRSRAISDGVSDARALVTAGDWKLVGALAYYAFDNAVLWAAFHAYGRAPAARRVVMGYLVGSLAGALPLPAGLGAVDGGLIGALVLYGAPAAPAAAAVLLYRGISLSVPVVLGAIGCACSTTTHRRFRARSAGCPVPSIQHSPNVGPRPGPWQHKRIRGQLQTHARLPLDSDLLRGIVVFLFRREGFWCRGRH